MPSAEQIFHYLKLGIVANLRLDKAATIDVVRRISAGLQQFMFVKDRSAEVYNHIARMYAICCAYEEMRLDSPSWELVRSTLAALPSVSDAEPQNLVNHLVTFPQHGDVIVAGTRNSYKSYNQFKASYHGLVEVPQIVADLSKSFDSDEELDVNDTLAVFTKLKTWYESAPVAYFDSFLFEENKVNCIGVHFKHIMVEIANTAVKQLLIDTLACLQSLHSGEVREPPKESVVGIL